MGDTVDAPHAEATGTAPEEPAPTPTTNNGARDLSTTLKSATDRILIFLSTASNETLGACIAGLGATTYIVLGRVGLLLIGAVGGVVLHATWEGKSQDEADKTLEIARRREIGLDVARRVLEWRSSRVTPQPPEDSDVPAKAADFTDFPPETAKALNLLTDAVIRDYVHWWYSPVLPSEESFPAVSRATFSTFLLGVANNISRKRPADTFLEFVTNSSSIVIVFLNEISSAVWTTPSKPANESIENYLASKPDSNLANITDPRQHEIKLLTVAEDILGTYLDAKVYNCTPVRVFLLQVLARLILDMTLERCSQDDWINEWIIYLLEDSDTEIISALDAVVEKSVEETAGPKKTGTDNFGASDGSGTANDHKRTRSRAEEAMEEAMREAQRLTQLMAEVDAEELRKAQSDNFEDTPPEGGAQGLQTPTSSQSDMQNDGPFTPAQSTETSQSVIEAQENEVSSPQALEVNTGPSIATIPAVDDESPTLQRPETFTLHNANVSIFDDSTPNDRRPLKAKPTVDYMIQIEPPSSTFSGWMIARTYGDFEKLHEVLRRISTISGAVRFAQAHAQLPAWKGSTKPQLTQELERYLVDALQHDPLAESEGMKRFLEKERGMSKSPRTKSGFWAGPAALETMGKGVFDVLSKAPRGVAGGGKAVIGGVSSVLGGAGSKSNTTTATRNPKSASVSSLGLSRVSTTPSAHNSAADINSRVSGDFQRSQLDAAEPRESSTFQRSQSSLEVQTDQVSPPTIIEKSEQPYDSHMSTTMNLPPPPSDIPDDYMTMSHFGTGPPTTESPITKEETMESAQHNTDKPARARRKTNAPLGEKETQVVIELIFAAINELYTLSSAWTLRRTLLNAARSYLLRPGNPQLDSIRQLLQESVLDSNTSDAGIAAHILKIRENSLPTEEELKKWPPPKTAEEKEKLRIKARKLVVTKAIPQALTSVMGMAASSEAAGRVFDALQDQKIAKGLMFGIMLQAIRALTQ